MRVSLLLLSACAGPLVSDVPVERVVADPAEAPPPGSLGLTARGVVPGGLATLTVDGATPGELVYLQQPGLCAVVPYVDRAGG